MSLYVMMIWLGFVAPAHKDMPMLGSPAYSCPLDIQDDKKFRRYE